MESPSPVGNKCLSLCNNNLFSNHPIAYERLSIDTVDSVNKANILNSMKHPGQAVKIITDNTGDHKIVKDTTNEVCSSKGKRSMKSSKSCANFDALDDNRAMKNSKSNTNLKDCKSCDENLIKFIFTKHGIQVISDVETIV